MTTADGIKSEATISAAGAFTESAKETALNEKRVLAPGLVPLSSITPEETTWLWLGYLPQGEMSVLCGRPDIGKSLFAIKIATEVSLPDGKLPVIPFRSDDPDTVLRYCDVPHGNVIYLSGDDSIAKTVHKRFTNMGADISNIHIWNRHQLPAFDSPEYGEMFEKVSPVLVVFDTFQHFFEGDMNAANKTTAALHSVLSLIRQYNTCGLMIMHPNKFSLNYGGDAIAAASGSLAIQGKCRSSLTAGFAPGFDGKTNHTRAICHTKGNLVEGGKPASILYETPKGGMVNWLRIDHDLTDNDLYGKETRPRGRPNQYEAAKAYIKEYLGGEMKPTEEVKAAAERDGIKKDTFYKAMRVLGGEYERVDGVSFVRVPGSC